MKRVKTKQEMRLAYNDRFKYAYGLPIDKVKVMDRDYIVQEDVTTDPHPFDSMDIKVRVTPKQSKKLQKKAFKMGYGWQIGGEKVTYDDVNHPFLYLKRMKSIVHGYSNEHNFKRNKATELTYKQFMNGSIPKEKKIEFKVGDWVETFGCTSVQDGTVGEITEIRKSKYAYFFRAVGGSRTVWLMGKTLKHTTKPKEQPLKFCGHEVKVNANTIQVGCKLFQRDTLNGFYEACLEAEGEATPNEMLDFIRENQSKLGL